MVPSDFRLPNVANGLITRLEGTRRSYADDPESAKAEFQRISEEHVAAAADELASLDLDEHDGHRRFLEQEIRQTFLPRYTRLAERMNALESTNFGLGALGEPAGRVALVAVALVGLMFFLRLIYLPWAWPMFLVDVSVPFWPDILRVLYRRRYAAQLQELLDDLGAIQEQATTYAPSSVETEPPRPRPQREAQ